MMNTPHDTYGKESLSRKEIAIDLLKGHLPKDILARIELASLEKANTEVVDDFFQYHNDIAYRVNMHDQDSYIVFLLELQHVPQKCMPFRMMRYMVLFWTDYMHLNFYKLIFRIAS